MKTLALPVAPTLRPSADKLQVTSEEQIVPGISLSASGEATVAPELADVLFDLAILLEESTKLPVDVQHVLAAIVLASRGGDLVVDQVLSADQTFANMLAPHVKRVFASHGGKVGQDD